MEIQQTPDKHPVLGGKAYVYKRKRSNYWQCATYLRGYNYRASTKESYLHEAINYAEEWYINLRGQASVGVLEPPAQKQEKEITFREVADKFIEEYSVITEGQRSPAWIEGHASRLRVHLLPFLGDLPISKVTGGKVQEYRVFRMTPQKKKNPNAKDNRPFKEGAVPAQKTLHNEIVTLRQVLKTAARHGWIESVPDLSAPYRRSGKVSHRPWFSPAEYQQLYKATRKYKKEALPHLTWAAEQLHDYVLFMGNTGLRPDEAKNLQHRDIEIVEDAATGERILVIEVRGKRGVGYCKSTAGAVRPYERLLGRAKKKKDKDGNPVYPQLSDKVFPGSHVKMFQNILEREGLRLDRDGKARTSYSLRHTYICMRLLEGADIYQIAKNCRTSVEMIEKHYAAHLKNTLDASAINVRKTGYSQAKNDREKH
ncbi:MAG: site-specific integrase [Rhodospirillales bacterium]|nr:site-specific integrase [Rhodospirillales bacterium]MCB9994849.1 site-specific integrase [Rhodospirillales bacterium]